jgi:hypothetical protein
MPESDSPAAVDSGFSGKGPPGEEEDFELRQHYTYLIALGN